MNQSLDHRVYPNILVVGSLNLDIAIQLSKYPSAGETVLGDKVHFIPGGKGANQAVGLARLGASVSMIGSVGDDMYGDVLMNALRMHGITTQTIQRTMNESTGIATVILNENDNSIIVVPGANYSLTPEYVTKHEQCFIQSDLILLQLEVPIETVKSSIDLAKKYNKKVILNPAPAVFLSGNFLSYVDYLTPNRSELSILTGINVQDNDLEALEEAMSMLIDSGVNTVITTLGSNGVAYMTKGENMCLIPAKSVEVVDTTGAGDCFNAGLALALAQGKSLHEAIHLAIHASAVSVTKFGAQNGMPTLEEVKLFFQLEQI